MDDALDWIVSTARQHDASLDHVVALELAATALPLADNGLDAPALARALMEAHPEVGVSEINAVAKAAVDFLIEP